MGEGRSDPAVELAGLPAEAELVPAGSAQRGLWLTQALDPTSPAYLVNHAFELVGDLNVPALTEAFDQLVARHEALRTGFVALNKDVHQVIHPRAVLTLPVEDVRDSADRDTAVAAAVAEVTGRPFDLTRPPLIRARLLCIDDGRHVLVVAVHHIVVDGTSMGVLWRELDALYRAVTSAGRSELPPLDIGYADFAAWEAGWLDTADYREQLAFWQATLDDAPAVIELPAHGSADGPGWRGGGLVVPLPVAETTALLELSRTHGVTPFMSLLLVFSGVLHRWTDQATVVVGSPVSIRDEPGLDNAVGMLVNTVPFRTEWGDDPTLAVALRRISAVTLDALARKFVPFDHIVAALPGLRVPGRAPVMQVMFGYASDQDSAAVDLRLGDLAVAPVRLPTSAAKFDLSLDCLLENGRLLCSFEWSDQVLSGHLGELFAGHFVAAIRHVLRHPESRVGEWVLAEDLGRPVPGSRPEPPGEPWTGWLTSAARRREISP